MTYRPYRRAVQAGVFALMFAVPILNLFEIYAVTGTFYAINIGGLGIADPVVILQAVFAAGTVGGPLLTAAIFPIFLALLFGRVWCGWMCPYHVIADGLSWARRTLRSRLFGTTEPEPLSIPRPFTANMTRYGFLAAGVIAAGAIGIPVLNYVSAPGIVSTEAMILVKERTVSIEIGFILLLIVLEITVLPRFWCRLFCPTGAFLAVFRGPFTLRVGTGARNPKSPCCSENHCSTACPMGLAPFREGQNLLCTNCGRCVDACTSKRLRFMGF
ncbi:MAG: 4Fe-4S binding protein [Desulfomonile tiedjei]|nr:4Fe-4S binding protein [Desulfomonile tiedjei]